MSVAYDNAASSAITTGVTTVSVSLTVGSGANRVAIIGLCFMSDTPTGISCSLGGVSGTLVSGTDSGTTDTAERAMLFSVVNPPSGSQTATASWTTSATASIGVITVSGANQSTPTNNGTYSYNGASATNGVTITSTSGALTTSVCANSGENLLSSSQTAEWGSSTFPLNGGDFAGGDIGPGTGTSTHTWNVQYSSQTSVVSGCNILEASSGPTSIPGLLLLLGCGTT